MITEVFLTHRIYDKFISVVPGQNGIWVKLYFWSKFSNKHDMVSAWWNFKNIFPRPLFIIIFRPEMLKFHPYSILTGDTRVEFVIYCVLNMNLIWTAWIYFKCFAKASFEPKLPLHIDSLFQKNQFGYAQKQCSHFTPNRTHSICELKSWVLKYTFLD